MQITKWKGLSKASPELLSALVRGAIDRGWDADALIGHIASESGFRPEAKAPGNSATASGLIQIIEPTLRVMCDAPPRKRGEAPIYTSSLRRLSAIEQLPFVFAFFERFGGGQKLKGADFKIIGFGVSPRWPDSRVFADREAQPETLMRIAYEQNAAFDVDGNGKITIGDVRAWWSRTEEAARARGTIEVEPGDPVTVPANLQDLLRAKSDGGSAAGFFSPS